MVAREFCIPQGQQQLGNTFTASDSFKKCTMVPDASAGIIRGTDVRAYLEAQRCKQQRCGHNWRHRGAGIIRSTEVQAVEVQA